MTYGYGLLLASLTSLCWGIVPILTKAALSEMRLGKVIFFRGLGLLTILGPMFFLAKAETIKELLSLSANSYLILALIAILNNIVSDLFYFAAIRDIGVSMATPIMSSYPLVVALVSWIWFDEVLTFSVLSGTLSILTGLVLLNIRASGTHSTKRSFRLCGVAYAIIAAVCVAVVLTLNKYLTSHGIASTVIVFWRGVFFSLMAIAFLPLLNRGEKETRHISPRGALAAAGGGIIGIIVGWWFYINSISIIPMSVATPVASTSPLTAAIFACAFMGERLRPIQWLGIVFVVAGAVAVGAQT